MNQANLKILVVDDESDTPLLFNQQFKDKIASNQFSFYYVSSGEEALKWLSENKEACLMLILSDITMPGMSGLSLLQNTKKAYPYLKVFMLTGYGDANNAQALWKHGADELLTKPIDFNYLTTLISNLQDFKKMGYHHD